MQARPPPLHLTAFTSLLNHYRNPPSIRGIALLTYGVADYPWFRSLIARYLPEHMPAILSHPNRLDQFKHFADAFERDYFPLSPYVFPDLHFFDYDMDFPAPWSILRQGVPYDLQGISYDQIHDLWTQNSNTGLPATALLCNMTKHMHVDNGIRPSWAAFAAEHLPPETMARIPPDGIDPDLIHAAVKDSFYQPVSLVVSWLFARTGNFFLDNYFDEEYFDGFSDPWEPDVLAEARSQWLQAHAHLTALDNFTAWMDRDLPVNFGATLDFILEHLPEPLP